VPFDWLSVSSFPINLAAFDCLAMLAIVDLRTRRVPQVVTLPALVALGVWRLWRGDRVIFLYWLAAFALYVFHICNAGDVKVIMIELALWPTPTFIIVLGLTVAVLGTIASMVRYRGVKRFLRSMHIAGGRLLSGRPPSEAELASSGAPQVFLYVAGAAVYLALFYAARYSLWRSAGG